MACRLPRENEKRAARAIEIEDVSRGLSRPMTGRCLVFFAKSSYRAVDMRVAVIGCEGLEHGMASERELEAGEVRRLLVRLEGLEFLGSDEPERRR